MGNRPTRLELVPKWPKNVAPAPSRAKNRRRPLTVLDVHRLRRAIWATTFTLLDKPRPMDPKTEQLRARACALSGELLSTLNTLQTRLEPKI